MDHWDILKILILHIGSLEIAKYIANKEGKFIQLLVVEIQFLLSTHKN